MAQTPLQFPGAALSPKIVCDDGVSFEACGRDSGLIVLNTVHLPQSIQKQTLLLYTAWHVHHYFIVRVEHLFGKIWMRSYNEAHSEGVSRFEIIRVRAGFKRSKAKIRHSSERSDDVQANWGRFQETKKQEQDYKLQQSNTEVNWSGRSGFKLRLLETITKP
jgi:hypothetical protein